MADKLSSPLILKYQRDFEEKPQSRVFVPLAESYRKVGLVTRAIDVLRQGLEFHPNYVTAHVVLGNCYYDLKQFERALRILSPLFDSGSENLKLLRLLANCHYELGELEEAKKFFKYLLFLNPNDQEAVSMLEKIEDRVPEQVLTDDLPEIKENRFDANIQKEIYKDADEWVRVDTKSVEEEDPEEVKVDEWTVGTIEETREKIKEELPTQISLDLVNIYQSQGLFERALAILNEYLKVNPKRDDFLRKKSELSALLEQKNQKFELKTLDDLPDELSSEAPTKAPNVDKEKEVQAATHFEAEAEPQTQAKIEAKPEPKTAKKEQIEQNVATRTGGQANSAQKERLLSFLNAIKKRAEVRKSLD